MLKIRLRRMGAKKNAFYRIVVSDSRSTPRSRFLEVLGTYDPGTDPATVKLDLETRGVLERVRGQTRQHLRLASNK